MAAETRIEWCDCTFNPWIGCTKISPACDHCYAAVSTPARSLDVEWGAGKARRRTSADNWKLPLRWDAKHAEFYAEHGRRRRVFCASLADVFDNEVPAEWLADLLNLIRRTPNLDWLLLTKRIGNLINRVEYAAHQAREQQRHDLATWLFGWIAGLFPPNVWIGATICNQAEADRDIAKLLRVPAAVRFLSIEPMLGPIDLMDITTKFSGGTDHFSALYDPDDDAADSMPYVDWVIAGGESGPHARPMHPDWARSLRDQCRIAGVPFLFKQWGEWAPDPDGKNRGRMFVYRDGSTDIPDYRVPDIGNDGETAMAPIGKKAPGRLLDGVLHDAFPEVPHG